jgi:hypothetical protein
MTSRWMRSADDGGGQHGLVLGGHRVGGRAERRPGVEHEHVPVLGLAERRQLVDGGRVHQVDDGPDEESERALLGSPPPRLADIGDAALEPAAAVLAGDVEHAGPGQDAEVPGHGLARTVCTARQR